MCHKYAFRKTGVLENSGLENFAFYVANASFTRFTFRNNALSRIVLLSVSSLLELTRTQAAISESDCFSSYSLSCTFTRIQLILLYSLDLIL